MGANSKQGWCVFVFLLGFTCLPAGLAYLGPVCSVLGLIFLIGSAIGFYSLKKEDAAQEKEARSGGPSSIKAASGFRK